MWFTDFKMVLDAQVYEGLEGQWRDLFHRMLKSVMTSVVKSFAGLQRRKFKVPLSPNPHSCIPSPRPPALDVMDLCLPDLSSEIVCSLHFGVCCCTRTHTKVCLCSSL